MKQLNQLLDSLQEAVSERNQSLSNTPQLGSMENTGRMTTQQTSQDQNQELIQSAKKLQQKEMQNGQLVKNNKASQVQLMVMLKQCWNTQKRFGQEESSFIDWEAVFQQTLGEYPCKNVESAMLKHIKSSREIPTPADTIAIIENKTPEDRRRNKIKYDKILRESREGKHTYSSDLDWLYKYENGEIPTVL